MRAAVLFLVTAIGCFSDHPTAPAKPVAHAASPDAALVLEVAEADAPAEELKPPPLPAVPDEDLDSKDILAREPPASPVFVKHVLIAWAALEPNYHGKLDPRAAARDNAQAAQMARDVLAKLKADPKQIDQLVTAVGEDPGALAGAPYEVKTDTPFVPEFKQLALRLQVGEAGIVRTHFGYHVMLRIAPPPPDPLESAAILARPAGKGPVRIQHILISWKDAPGKPADPRAERTKAEADALAKSVLARARRGEKMAALMKEVSEDPGSKDDGRAYDVATESAMIEPFKNMALRLKLGEVGLVKSESGWHVMKRIAPPPPDALASAGILARKPASGTVKVKHILLGWTDVHAGDERGVTRTRAELEKLVKATVAKLRGGAAIEPLMAELSEDPGTAHTGDSYEVADNGTYVRRFVDLALRLKVGEVGVVDTNFGIHIILRTE
jgi:parvulin-like peptidyl-prolyl isomerase